MLRRYAIAVVVGAALAFAWGAAAWMSGLYEPAFRPMPGGGDLPVRIDATVPEDGTYVHPSIPDMSSMNEQQRAIAVEACMAEHEKGPLMMLFVHREGSRPGDPQVLLRGFAIELAGTALLGAIVAAFARLGAGTGARCLLALGIAAFAVLGTHVLLWNFLHLPAGYSVAMAFDGFMAWAAAGLACALIIRPAKA